MRNTLLTRSELLLTWIAALTLTAAFSVLASTNHRSSTTSTAKGLPTEPCIVVTIDFDTGLPSLSTGLSTPLNQTLDGLTANFGSPSDPAAFSIQSQSTTFFTLSQFSGNYMYQNSPFRIYLDIRFSQPLTNITLRFATIEYHGGPGDEPSNLKLTAYMDSTGTTPVGSATARGAWSSDSFPQGALTFVSAGSPFNLVRIEVLFQPQGASVFLVDNITVATTGALPDTTPPVTSIALSGVLGDQGWHTSNVTVNLSATDDLSGVAKTEFSLDNITWTIYTSPFAITNEGTTTIYYRSTDNAGNNETAKTQTTKIDRTTPTGSILINGDNATTASTSVELTLTQNDATSGVSQVRYSNDGTWDTEPWEPPSPTKTWTLSTGDGTKTVYYQIRDNAGLTSSTYPDTITLDTTRPTADAGQNRTVNAGETVSLDAGASGDNVGIVSYQWDFGDGTTGTGKTVTHTYNTPGTYTVTLTVRDAAGNTATRSITVNALSNPTTSGQPFPWWIVPAIAATGIIATTGLLLRRRR